jgi:hypothetical protein
MTELTYTEEVVPIEKLKEDEEFRSLVPPNNMKEQLVSSIVKNGQTLPIDVDSDYVILDGYTRVSILRELKYKEVKIRKWNFRSKENRAMAYRLIAMLNLQRRHLEKNEVLKLLRELVEKIEKSSKEVQKLSANADNLEQNSEINMKPNKTEIKPKEVQKLSANADNLEQNSEINMKPNKTEIKPKEVQKLSANADNLEQNSEINMKPRELELKMKQVKEEIGAKEVSDSDIQEYSLISTIPYLRQLVDEGKISVRSAYELYKKAKDKLQKIANLPKYEREQLLTTKEGRKIILERDDLLELILQHKMAVSQAINKLKTEEKLKKTKGSKPMAKEDLEDEEEDSESNDEYDFVGEWQRANEEEEKEKLLTREFNGKDKEAPPTRIEIHTPKADLDSLYKAIPSIKKLVDAGKLTEKDVEKVYEIWRNMEAIYKQASLLWYNTVDVLLRRVGLSEKEREEIFYEMVKPYFKLFSKEEVFPKEVLERKL